MRLLIETHHPAHIHFFKHAVRHFRAQGAEVLLLGRDRDVMQRLLASYDDLPSRIITQAGKNNTFPLQEMVQRQWQVARTIREFEPDAVLSLMGSYSQSARMLGVPNIVFTDSEFQHFNHRIAHPFATRIYTPECFYKPLGPKQRTYRGYHELAFLHPKRFRPDRGVLDLLGVEAGRYVIVRVSAWDTLHDVGESGFGAQLDETLEALSQRFRVFIVPEQGKLAARWRPMQLELPPHRFHDALAFAAFVVSEGASTAAEAACLGVHALYLNSTTRGYLNDMARRYGLVSIHQHSDDAQRQLRRWLTCPPTDGQKRAQELIADHIDVTDFVIHEIENLV